MRPLSFAQALNLGLQPREYGTSVPEGEYIARLDFRIWGNSVNLHCFFTHMETGENAGEPAEVWRAQGAVRALLDTITPRDAGYRLYYFQQGNALVVLLCGGDKTWTTKTRSFRACAPIPPSRRII